MSLFDVSRVSVEVGGEEISFETGKLARQAGGAVVVRSGDTMVLCTATAGNLRDVDFLPLTVDVEERHYAAGKIPGSFFRREGRAGERATLTARMIDRPLRPLFPKGWHYETQIVCQPMSVEFEHSYDILAMNGASAAVAISQIPVPTHVGVGADRQARGRFRPQPRGGDRGRARDGPRRLRVQRGDPDGGVRGERRHRGRGPRRPRHRPRGDQEDLRGDRGAARQGGQGEARGGGAEDRPGPGRADPLLARGEARRGDPGAREARPSGGRQGGRGGGARAVRERLRWRGPGPRAERRGLARVRRAREGDDPPPDRGRQEAARRPRRGRDPADRMRGGHLTPRARLGAVHPRGDADPLQRGVGHEPHGHAGRQPQPGRVEDLLAPLQLPAVLGRGGRLHARPEAPRHRPRRARRASAGAHDPEPGRLPLRGSGRLGDPGVERVLVDGLGLRLVDGADGRRRAGFEPRGRASRWA